MATKKRTAIRNARPKAKAKSAARPNVPRKAKIEHAGSVKGIVYTSVLRELMARRLAKG
jgi:hypothetical protein